MLVVHHLHTSQSERIVWLCEELGLDYVLELHARDPVTRLGPPSYKALHPMGTAPVIEDDGVVLGESGAIVEYLLAKYGQGRLVLSSTHPDYATYVYWLHFANGTLQAVMGRTMVLARSGAPADSPMVASTRARLDHVLGLLETHLAKATWLAGAEFTAADVMSVFSLTTMRLFHPLDLAPYPNIRAWLARVGERPAYRRAMAKADPGMTPLLS